MQSPDMKALPPQRTKAGIQLGLRANWQQFALLVLINAFVGGMVGLERSIVPLLGQRVFGLASTTALLSFIVSFGVVKALANLFAGRLSDRIGRRMKLQDLHVLMTVVQTGSMRKAATLLNTSQPAISRSIAELENAVGVRLLDRYPHGVGPTAYGQALLHGSRERCLWLAGRAKIDDWASRPQAELHIEDAAWAD